MKVEALIFGALLMTATPLAQGAEIEACAPAPAALFSDHAFADFLSNVKRINSCVPFPMRKGSSKILDLTAFGSVTGIEQRYILTAISDNSFRADLNIKFVGVPDVPLSPASAMEMKDSVNNCLKEINPFLRGPRGETLTIQTDIVDAPEVEIQLDQPGVRSHSRKWAQKVDCPTILHEILHLMGLADEYVDQDENKKIKYNCRIEGSAFSIMNANNNAYSMAKNGLIPSLLMPHHFYSIIAGDCIEGESTYAKCARRAYAAAQNQQDCLAGEVIVKQCHGIFRHSFANHFKERFMQETNSDLLMNLRMALVAEFNSEEGVRFFLPILKNSTASSKDLWEQSAMAIRALLEKGSIDDASSDQLLDIFLKRIEKDPNYIYQLQDIVQTLLKNRDPGTWSNFCNGVEPGISGICSPNL